MFCLFFICWWALGLLLSFGFCQYCCYENGCILLLYLSPKYWWSLRFSIWAILPVLVAYSLRASDSQGCISGLFSLLGFRSQVPTYILLDITGTLKSTCSIPCFGFLLSHLSCSVTLCFLPQQAIPSNLPLIPGTWASSFGNHNTASSRTSREPPQFCGHQVTTSHCGTPDGGGVPEGQSVLLRRPLFISLLYTK